MSVNKNIGATVAPGNFAEAGGRSIFIPAHKVDSIFQLMRPVNRLACQFCLETGFRIGDVLNLRTRAVYEAITANNCWLRVQEEKTGKSRRVRISKLWASRLMGVAGVIYVFEGKDLYTPRTRQAVYRDFKRRARRVLGAETRASVHSLRKNYAVAKYRETGDLQAVQRDLNHERLGTTVLYALADVLPGDPRTPGQGRGG